MNVTELYRHFDAEGKLLYVGISRSAFIRFMEHRFGSHWSFQVSKIEIERYATRKEAEQAETDAIVKENPLYNKAKRGAKVSKIGMKTVNPYKDARFAPKSSLLETFAKLGIKVNHEPVPQ